MKEYVTSAQVEQNPLFSKSSDGRFLKWLPKEAALEINEYLNLILEGDLLKVAEPRLNFPLYWLLVVLDSFNLRDALQVDIQCRMDKFREDLRRCELEISQSEYLPRRETVEEYTQLLNLSIWLEGYLHSQEKLEWGITNEIKRLCDSLGLYPKHSLAEAIILYMYFEWAELRWQRSLNYVKIVYWNGKDQRDPRDIAGEILAKQESSNQKERAKVKRDYGSLLAHVEFYRRCYKELGDIPGVVWRIREKLLNDGENGQVIYFLLLHSMSIQPYEEWVDWWKRVHLDNAKLPRTRAVKPRTPHQDVVGRHARILYDVLYHKTNSRSVKKVWSAILEILNCLSRVELYPLENWRSFRRWITADPGLWRSQNRIIKISGEEIPIKSE